MKKIFKYIIAYGMWFVDLALATWLLFVSRKALLVMIAEIFDPTDYQYPFRAEAADKAFTLLLGIGWLAFMIITEEYFRAGIQKENLKKRVAQVTGPLLLCIFVIDLILFGLQGLSSENWFRWPVLLTELVMGLFLVFYARKNATNKSGT